MDLIIDSSLCKEGFGLGHESTQTQIYPAIRLSGHSTSHFFGR